MWVGSCNLVYDWVVIVVVDLLIFVVGFTCSSLLFLNVCLHCFCCFINECIRLFSLISGVHLLLFVCCVV